MNIVLLLMVLLPYKMCWKPPGLRSQLSDYPGIYLTKDMPGMSERLAGDEAHDHQELTEGLPRSHQSHHDHRDNVDLADLVTDTEHMVDDLGEWFSQAQLDRMEADEKVFTWFTAHDWDEDDHLDGLELLKALRYELSCNRQREF